MRNEQYVNEIEVNKSVSISINGKEEIIDIGKVCGTLLLSIAQCFTEKGYHDDILDICYDNKTPKIMFDSSYESPKFIFKGWNMKLAIVDMDYDDYDYMIYSIRNSFDFLSNYIETIDDLPSDFVNTYDKNISYTNLLGNLKKLLYFTFDHIIDAYLTYDYSQVKNKVYTYSFYYINLLTFIPILVEYVNRKNK